MTRARTVAGDAHATTSAIRRSTAGSRVMTISGVRFTQEPLTMGPVTTAVLDDTCGNLIQIASAAPAG